jgi:hypothetical protein
MALAAEFVAMFQNPERYVTPVSRGLEPRLSDAVVKMDGGQVDFAPAFGDLNPDTYSIRMDSLPQPGATYSVLVRWTGNGPANSAAQDLKPGLYRVARLSPQHEPPEAGAWILVDSPDKFQKDSASFHAALEEIKKLPDDVDSRVPGAVLRAHLEALAKGTPSRQ